MSSDIGLGVGDRALPSSAQKMKVEVAGDDYCAWEAYVSMDLLDTMLALNIKGGTRVLSWTRRRLWVFPFISHGIPA